ncbi:MAG: DUF2807 domain-containing protein [Flavobacteriales bacterium]|nr:DUF2807 domain-containing protein [Flavobacteriia bacterium]NCP05474.1 DUF2807 domain-containing protein [Flavobacteriales bacterium]PIV93170.1 MAG: DUF2807 domain-containing protein [Flavobacteriaceae bacterium CG17_big_fil_post_rev_8_21_14_2_50_33_15]PIY09898.1 MAG: DUF2807 domain-containing protein [Flavobacteriaceae bacterium CG_4_10_14_3_um_filter_33_47]PJB17910.1 MAG: DUF2807 domain-containing protein [Flavobacteriaceae bacterium CG_4_9_14_3_um_filter_33_16]
MTTLIKFLIATVLSLSFFSCNFDMNFIQGVKGNGNIQLENRIPNQSFNTIKASQGLEVYLTQGNEESIVIEADENLHAIIKTEVKDNELLIYADKNIEHASAKKIMVTFKDVIKITSTSGSDVISNNTINADYLELDSSSGSNMNLNVNTSTLTCNSSSGSDLKLSGKTERLIAEASSGSDIKAANLIAESSQVKAASGADITVNTVKELTANANSGGNIKYYGNPEKVNISDAPSGSIEKR